MTYLLVLGLCLVAQKQNAQNFNITIDHVSDESLLCPGYTDDDDGDVGRSILVLEDGFLILGGSWIPELCGWTAIVIWKTDFNGNVLWQKVYGEEGFEYFGGLWGHLLKTLDGNFAFVGSINNTFTEDSDAFLMKFDENGDSLWLKTYGGPLGDIAYRGKQLPDGGFIFTGTTRNFGNAGFDNTDIYVVRTDSEGEVIWQKGYGLGGYELGASVVLTPDGGFIIGGDREGAGF